MKDYFLHIFSTPLYLLSISNASFIHKTGQSLYIPGFRTGLELSSHI